jgi:hypothetical protein
MIGEAAAVDGMVDEFVLWRPTSSAFYKMVPIIEFLGPRLFLRGSSERTQKNSSKTSRASFVLPLPHNTQHNNHKNEYQHLRFDNLSTRSNHGQLIAPSSLL